MVVAENALSAFRNDIYLVFDLLAVFPFWAQLVIGHHRLLYLMRALRMLRLLKVRGRHPGPAPRPRAPPGASRPRPWKETRRAAPVSSQLVRALAPAP